MGKYTVFVCLIVLLFIIGFSEAQPQTWCGIQTLYFQHNPSTSPPGYEELINYPSGNTEVDENVTIKSSDGLVLVDNYIMPENSLVGTTELLQGLRRYRFYSYVSGASGTTTFNFTAFRRFINGTEQNFYTAQSQDIDALTVTEYTLDYVSQVTLQLNPSDRLGIRVFAKTTLPAPISVHWVYQGTTHASNFESGFFVCPTQNPVYFSSQKRVTLPEYIVIFGLIVAGILLFAYKRN